MDNVQITKADVGVVDADAIKTAKPKIHAGQVIVKSVFCAKCQAKTSHECGLDKYGEVVCLCACGHAIKFPVHADNTSFEAALATHEEANAGQITVEMDAVEQDKRDAAFRKMMGIE